MINIQTNIKKGLILLFMYFVSYFGVENNITSYGNTVNTRDEEIKTEEDIREVEKAIKEKFKFDSLVLLNITKL